MFQPVFEELSTQHSDIQFLKVDVDSLPNLTNENGVFSMPSFLVFDNKGQKKMTLEGANRDGLERLIEATYNLKEKEDEKIPKFPKPSASSSKSSNSKEDKAKRPSFEAPVYKPEDGPRKRMCCIIS